LSARRAWAWSALRSSFEVRRADRTQVMYDQQARERRTHMVYIFGKDG